MKLWIAVSVFFFFVFSFFFLLYYSSDLFIYPQILVAGGKSKIFEHDFDLFSSCGTPEFTNYTDDFKGCLDYIFCQKHIQVLQCLPFPPEEELAIATALPNQYFPSDHISLVADLLL